jgi:hypothetical protein
LHFSSKQLLLCTRLAYRLDQRVVPERSLAVHRRHRRAGCGHARPSREVRNLPRRLRMKDQLWSLPCCNRNRRTVRIRHFVRVRFDPARVPVQAVRRKMVPAHGGVVASAARGGGVVNVPYNVPVSASIRVQHRVLVASWHTTPNKCRHGRALHHWLPRLLTTFVRPLQSTRIPAEKSRNHKTSSNMFGKRFRPDLTYVNVRTPDGALCMSPPMHLRYQVPFEWRNGAGLVQGCDDEENGPRTGRQGPSSDADV